MKRCAILLSRVAVLTCALAPLFLGFNCHSTPDPTQPHCTSAAVFEHQTFYVERPEPEREFRGVLELRNVLATPNGRDHRFFLGDVPVYSGGTQTQRTLDGASGASTIIRGKLVRFTHGLEIWPASVTVCR